MYQVNIFKAQDLEIDEEQKLVHGENHESFLKPKMKLTLNPQRYARMSHLPQGNFINPNFIASIS